MGKDQKVELFVGDTLGSPVFDCRSPCRPIEPIHMESDIAVHNDHLIPVPEVRVPAPRFQLTL
jgi:hypothetical protein